jgi:hypothetical protein
LLRSLIVPIVSNRTADWKTFQGHDFGVIMIQASESKSMAVGKETMEEKPGGLGNIWKGEV